MAGIHLISGSLIQSGSLAQFKNGISVKGETKINGSLIANIFNNVPESNIRSAGGSSNSLLKVGRSLDDGTFVEWEASVGDLVRISASGNFDNFCFIENQTLEETGINSTWKTVQKGQFNGRIPQSFYERTYNEAGIYEYLIIANSTQSLQTVVKGTTVTIT